ncbi:HAD-IA family hydrolase [Lysobacter sp. MMG2]|uniref:HAD-IA family hydrolase n=1 Tax=Lysobacter sp. MMG2 TaxID=2801338 RepID=UPI001C228B59|nr:HAD-IA family hydrolase [Lysobacter sp. MMG2]MBU8977089.1 HAD-IA family hydrolase [Lysobacter sp. MMG2]
MPDCSALLIDFDGVLVTNATSRLPQDLAALGLTPFFHGVANSSALGTAKPDAAIFHAALALAGVAAHEALFVDDSSRNVAAAGALGIHARRFEGPATLRALLHEHGVTGVPRWR